MRKILSAFLILSFLSNQSHAAFAFIGNTTAKSADSNNCTTPGIDTTGADLIVIVIAGYFNGGAITVSDNKSNSYTARTTYGFAGTGALVRTFYLQSPITGTGHTFTASSSAGYPSIYVETFSGVDTTSPYDSENGKGDYVLVTTIQPGSVTPGGANYLFVSGCMWYDSYNYYTVSVNSSFNLTDQNIWTSGAAEGGAMAYKIAAGAGAENPTWSMTTFTSGATDLTTFKVSAGAAGTPLRRGSRFFRRG